MSVVEIVDHSKSKKKVAASFGAKVAAYGKNAIVQRRLLEKLLPRVIAVAKPRTLWLDAGCGDGAFERMLYGSGFAGELLGIDIARPSLAFCRERAFQNGSLWVCADIDALPLKLQGVDGIVSASVLQWTGKQDIAMAQFSGLLKPGGHLVFSIFTEGSFMELIEMRNRFNLSVSVNLPCSNDFCGMLERYDFSIRETESFFTTVHFPSAMSLLGHLSAIGSTGAVSERMSRSKLLRFCSSFEEAFGTEKGIPLTYRALLGSATKERL